MTPPPPGPTEPAWDVTAVTDTQAVTVPDPLSAPIKSNDIYGRRKKAEKSQWGVAARSHSESFKSGSSKSKPKSNRWEAYFSRESASRKGSIIKQTARFLSKPGLISLGGGLPSSEYFPFETLSSTVPVPPRFSEADVAAGHGAMIESRKHDLAEDKSIFDISTAFNYGQGSGAAQLLRWITEHTELVHDPPYADWACTMTIGSTSALDMALRIFAEPGDTVLTEEYTFATAVDTMLPMGMHCFGIAMDAEGLLPGALDEVLKNWQPEAHHGSRKPRLLYTVPTGQNPTGATQGVQRRREIYAVCQTHNIYILEDEPYYFLQMQPYAECSSGSGGSEEADAPPKTHEDFLRSLVPSFLSMDTDGRVLRMDSFSKVLSPGARIGWVTAADHVIERYQMHADVSTQGPSGVSQLLFFKLLDEHWGHEGYLDWLIHIRLQYTRRRNVILKACERYLPRDIVSWTPPAAGMFQWMRVAHEKHPSRRRSGAGGSDEDEKHPVVTAAEIEERIFAACVERNALVMRGSWFCADGENMPDSVFFRATFAAAPEGLIFEAIRRFGDAVRHVFEMEGEADDGAGGVTANGTANGTS